MHSGYQRSLRLSRAWRDLQRGHLHLRERLELLAGPQLRQRAVLHPDDVRRAERELRLDSRRLRRHARLRHVHAAGVVWRDRRAEPVRRVPLSALNLVTPALC
jgi:hypothetical protein